MLLAIALIPSALLCVVCGVLVLVMSQCADSQAVQHALSK